jgi:hypothetical protein
MFILDRNRSVGRAPKRGRGSLWEEISSRFRGRFVVALVLISGTRCVHKAVAMQSKVTCGCSFGKSGGSRVFVH